MWLCWSRNHIIIEYPELGRTHKDHQNPTPGPTQAKPKNHMVCLRALSSVLVIEPLSGLLLWPLCWGACSSAQHLLVEVHFINIQPNHPLAQLHAVPSGPNGYIPTLKATLSSVFKDRNGKKMSHYSPASLLTPPTMRNSKPSKERNLALWGRLFHTSLRPHRQPS